MLFIVGKDTKFIEVLK